MKKNVFPLIFAAMLTCFSCANTKPKEYIAIVSAMDVEISLLLKRANIKESKTIANATFHVGEINGKNVIIARSGIGKINASSAFTSVVNFFDLSSVIFTGVAGGVKDEEKVLDQVVATKLVEHDYGLLSNEGFTWYGGNPGLKEPGEVYECDPALVDLAYNCSLSLLKDRSVYKGTIATGDQFVASEQYLVYLQEEFDAYACEMEGAAIAKVCEAYELPFVIMRTLSDKADGKARESYVDFVEEAANQSSSIVLKMLESL